MVFGDRVWEKIEDIKSVYSKLFGNPLVNNSLDVFIANFNDMLCFQWKWLTKDIIYVVLQKHVLIESKTSIQHLKSWLHTLLFYEYILLIYDWLKLVGYGWLAYGWTFWMAAD